MMTTHEKNALYRAAFWPEEGLPEELAARCEGSGSIAALLAGDHLRRTGEGYLTMDGKTRRSCMLAPEPVDDTAYLEMLLTCLEAAPERKRDIRCLLTAVAQMACRTADICPEPGKLRRAEFACLLAGRDEQAAAYARRRGKA